ncbi:MAG: hypothetical protein WCI18_00220 [Pseudomonadota bacterium]
MKLHSKHILVLDGSAMIRWLLNIFGGIHVETLEFQHQDSNIDRNDEYSISAMKTSTFNEVGVLDDQSKNAIEEVTLPKISAIESDTNNSYSQIESLKTVIENKLVADSFFVETSLSGISNEPKKSSEPNEILLVASESDHKPYGEDLVSLSSSEMMSLPSLETLNPSEVYKSDSQLPVIEDTPEWTYGYDPNYQRRVLAVTSKFIQKMDNQDAADFVNTLDPLLVEELLKDNSLPPVVKGIVIGKKFGKSQVSLANFLNTQKALKNNLHGEKSQVHPHNLTGVKNGN